MVDRIIKPYREEHEEQTRRAEQTRVYRRNQAIGLVMMAGVVLVWCLWHTNPAWIFPPGWWRP